MTVVQSLWLGARLSALQVLSLRSFLAHGHEVHLYALEPIGNVPSGIRVLDADSILPRDSVFTYRRGFGRGSPSAFSNLFRYKLLLERGGWWVDTDLVCLRPFDFQADVVFASERGADGHASVASCAIKSPPGADWLRYCFESADQRDKTSLQWGDIGPKLMHEAVGRFALEAYVVPPDVFNPIDYAAFYELQAAATDRARLDQSFAVHLWNQKWVSHCLDPDFDGEPGSLYATLRSEYLQPADRAYALGNELVGHVAFQRARLDELLRSRDDAVWEAEVSAHEAAGLRDELRVSRDTIEHLERIAERLRSTEDLLQSTQVQLDDTIRLLDDMTARGQEAESNLRDQTARLHESAEQLVRSERALVETEEQLVRTRSEVARLHGSLSWRITRPLRSLYDILRVSGTRSHHDT